MPGECYAQHASSKVPWYAVSTSLLTAGPTLTVLACVQLALCLELSERDVTSLEQVPPLYVSWTDMRTLHKASA